MLLAFHQPQVSPDTCESIRMRGAVVARVIPVPFKIYHLEDFRDIHKVIRSNRVGFKPSAVFLSLTVAEFAYDVLCSVFLIQTGRKDGNFYHNIWTPCRRSGSIIRAFRLPMREKCPGLGSTPIAIEGRRLQLACGRTICGRI